MSKQELMVPDTLGGGKVRTHCDGGGKLWFALVDVCRSLEYKDVANARSYWRSKIDSDEMEQINLIDCTGRNQQAWFITRDGLLQLLALAEVPKAKPFQKWLFKEVLPTLFDTGTYSLTPKPQKRPWSMRIDQTLCDHLTDIETHHPGCWSVVSALVVQMLALEDELIEHLLPVDESDLPDGSVGQRWSRHRRELGMPDTTMSASLVVRGKQRRVDVFSNEERPTFIAWHRECYLPSGSVQYLTNKFSPDHGKLPPASVADNVCRRLASSRAELPATVIRLIDNSPDKRIKANSHLLTGPRQLTIFGD